MPHWLRSDLRRSVCIVVAMLYALSVFAPHFAHAHALPPCAADSFTVSEHHHGPGAAHHHANAEQPASHGKHGDNDTDPKCCAQISLTILPQQNVDPAFTGLSHSSGFPPLVAKLTGRGADRLDRPPNI